MTRHLGSLVPCGRPAELARQGDDAPRDGVADRQGAVAGERRAVPCPRTPIVAGPGREVRQHGEPRRAFSKRAAGRAVQPQDRVALPVTRHRPTGRLRGPPADHDLGGGQGTSPVRPGPRLRQAKGPPRPKAGRPRAARSTPALDQGRLTDRLVRDAHGRVVRGLAPQSVRDPLRAPPPRPSGAAGGGHGGVRSTPPAGPLQDRPLRPRDPAGRTVLDAAPQVVAPRQPQRLRPPGRAVRMPLRRGRPVLLTTAWPSRWPRRMAPPLPRDDGVPWRGVAGHEHHRGHRLGPA